MTEVKSPVLTIEGFEDKADALYFRVSMAGKGKEPGVIKILSYEDLVEMLDSSKRKAPVKVPVGKFPEGYLDAELLSGGGGRVRIFVPGVKRCFLLDVGKQMPKDFHIPYPDLLFEISYGPDKTPHGSVWCVKGGYEEVKAAYYAGKLELFDYPFGNVSGDGGICMGNMNYIRVSEMADVSEFTDAFFGGITNSDYIGTGSRVKPGYGQMKLLQELSKKESFPEKWLRSCDFTLRLFK